MVELAWGCRGVESVSRFGVEVSRPGLRGAHARDVRSCRRVRSAKDDSNREPVGAAAARGGKTHDAHLMEMLLLWHLLI